MRAHLAAATLSLAALAPSARAQMVDTVPTMVQVEARIVLVDRQRAARAGLRWLQAGGGRIVLGDRGAGIRISKGDATLSASAFIEIAAREGVVTSDTRLSVATRSGTTARVASGTLALGRRGAVRETGPELLVTPTRLADGRIQLEVRARERDEATGRWGERVDASPVDAATTVLARPGEPATVATVRSTSTGRDAGLLRWEGASRSVDALVVLTVR
ncbi:MAG TPA: hypothetical protein VEA99_20380 [Gemmatimonadaceae bacterium]|nr:hypothetical protein [Gemmatimonadaceae bacterium]